MLIDFSYYLFLSVFARISHKTHYIQKKDANSTFSDKLGEQQETELEQSLMPCAKLQDLCLSLCRWTFLC